MVEIAKAVGADAKVVIMDEPTASLMDDEVDRLFSVIAMLRAQGAGVVYISHRLEEVFAVSDRITVLRDGETVATARPPPSIDRAELIQTMVGRALTEVFPKRPVAPGDVAIELRHLSNRALGIHDVSLSVRRGEVLGVAGLVGSGRTELAETLFGLVPSRRRRDPAARHAGAHRVAGAGHPARHRLRAGGSPPARRGAGDADRGRTPAWPASARCRRAA